MTGCGLQSRQAILGQIGLKDSNNQFYSINPLDYSGLADDDVTVSILAPLVGRALDNQQSLVGELDMSDVINQVLFIEAKLVHADFSEIQSTQLNFLNADLSYANLEALTSPSSQFCNAKLIGTIMSFSDLSYSNFKSAEAVHKVKNVWW